MVGRKATLLTCRRLCAEQLAPLHAYCAGTESFKAFHPRSATYSPDAARPLRAYVARCWDLHVVTPTSRSGVQSSGACYSKAKTKKSRQYYLKAARQYSPGGIVLKDVGTEQHDQSGQRQGNAPQEAKLPCKPAPLARTANSLVVATHGEPRAT